MKTITLFIAALLVATSSFAHSDALKPEYVDMLLTPYFELQKALAEDDLATAKKHVAIFGSMLSHGPSHDNAPSLTDLSEEAKKISNAADIKVARHAFFTISQDLARMVKHVGTSGKSDVYKMHCPMAFGGKGGMWLQNSDSLKNPYYGSMMLKCGVVLDHMAEDSTGL